MNLVTLHVDSNTRVWQCGCGQGDIDYSNVCLAYDVIMIGPGNGGQYPDCLTSPVFETACIETGQNVGCAKRYVKQIADEMEDGEIVVLRRGRKIVRGVGVVVGGYLYYPLGMVNFRI